MKHDTSPRIITANDLLSGRVVYLGAAGGWVGAHEHAVLFADLAEASARLAGIEAQDGSVVGPYLAPARHGAQGSPVPVHFREAMRATGPTNRFFGKQANTSPRSHGNV